MECVLCVHVCSVCVPIGQFYTLYFKGNTNLQLPSKVKTVLALTFFDEHDKRVEFSRWQYWYNLQPNPNQKAFDIGKPATPLHLPSQGNSSSVHALLCRPQELQEH